MVELWKNWRSILHFARNYYNSVVSIFQFLDIANIEREIENCISNHHCKNFYSTIDFFVLFSQFLYSPVVYVFYQHAFMLIASKAKVYTPTKLKLTLCTIVSSFIYLFFPSCRNDRRWQDKYITNLDFYSIIYTYQFLRNYNVESTVVSFSYCIF
jgi:hypothetical protein